ncbi:MAG: bifunctional phosphoglucose/phosphomannose isomerase [Chitinophagales bacterium]|nr:bifunctional phosphoglucose/phosphomannose isomerase [Chitinophagales bacterium]
MKNLVQNFPTQLHEAILIGKSHRFATPKKKFANVVLTGLGGSGIGGSIVQNFTFDKLKVPFIVNKDYFLPAFVNNESLVIVSSYSGNTEETIQAMKQALKAKATVVCITSGGTIGEMAKRRKLDCILLPSGMPPRACIGYSMTQVLYVLQGMGLLKYAFEKELTASIKLLKNNVRSIQSKARSLAKKLYGTTPIIYSGPEFEGMAIRFRQQINENGKMLCWHHVIPEMNHNELVGWRDKTSSRSVVILRSKDDYVRTQLRMEINKKVIKKYTKKLTELYSEGNSYWEQVFYFIHLTDWVSVYLADMRNQDAVEVKVIDFLKGELAKHK